MAPNHIKTDAGYERRLCFAIDAIKKNENAKVRQIARLYDVSESTIRGRLRGSIERKKSAQNRRKLTPTEEASLLAWILSLERRGCLPRPSMLQDMADLLLKERDPTRTPSRVGKNWVASFIKRQPILITKYARRLTYSRARCEDPIIIKAFFDNLKTLKIEHGITDEDIYNFDETCYAMGVAATTKVICSSNRTEKPGFVQPGSREWATVIECVGSTGKVLPPLIIFKSTHHQAEWFTDPNLPSDWSITYSQEGWTSDEIGLQWLEKVFEPFTRPLTIGTHRLLILDGHSSHLTPAFDRLCSKYNIIPCCLPAHSSHLLQPLDVGVFWVLKRLYGNAVENRIRNNIHHVDKQDFLQMLLTVRDKTYTVQNIKGGFLHAGIVPFDPEKVLSRLQLTVQPITPNSSNTSPSSNWSPKTPYNTRTLERQAKSIRKMLNINIAEASTASNQALNQLIKGSLITMHNAAILAKENHELRTAIDRLQHRRVRRTRALQSNDILTVSEGLALAQSSIQTANSPPAESGGA